MKEDQYSFLKEKTKSKDFNSVFVLVDENLPELIFSAMDKYGSISIY